MNILKLITKSGRQSLARDLLKDYLTPQTVAEYAAKGVNSLLGRIKDKEKLGTVAVNVEQGAALLALVSKAISDGEVTGDEAAEITGRVQSLCGSVVTVEQVDALVEKVVALVP